tara:strand:+ start:614 stop:1132 length:519 start_codon:yes stop_codon:yes gene_type:complete
MTSQLRVDKIVPVDGVPSGGGGGIVQIVQSVKTDTFTSSANSTWTDITGMTVSITPKFSSSKILISVIMGISNGSDELHVLRLLRGSTPIGASTGGTYNGFAIMDSEAIGGTRSRYIGHVKAEILDSPSTTSATTYKVQFWKNGGNSMHVNRRALNDASQYSSTITAYEVSA